MGDDDIDTAAMVVSGDGEELGGNVVDAIRGF